MSAGAGGGPVWWMCCRVSFFRKVDTARQQITHEEAIEINNQFGEAAPADFVELKLELGAGRAINTTLFTAPPQPPCAGRRRRVWLLF